MEANNIITAADDSPFALFAVDDVVYGVSSDRVLSIEILQTPTPLVNAPHYSLGIIDFRGDMIPLVGLRKLFNKSVRGSGLRSFMARNHDEHVRWVDSLETAVKSGGAFDARLCSFGDWLDSFTSQSNSLNMHIKKMISPHQLLHEAGAEILALAQRGAREEAYHKCTSLRSTELATVLQLIDSTADEYIAGIREMLLVLNVNGETKGIVVDDIVAVEYIHKFIGLPNSDARSRYVKTLAKRDKDDSTVLIMDEEMLITL